MHAQNSGDRIAVVVDESRRRPAVDHDVRRAQRAREPARARAARGGRATGRTARVVRTRTRSRCSRRSTPRASCNLVAVPLSYRFNAEEMQYVIDNSDATVVVVDAEQAPLVASVRDQLPKVRAVVVFGGDRARGLRRVGRRLSPASPTPSPTSRPTSEAGAAMIYTSGTTGKPKGALRTRTDRADRVRAARRARTCCTRTRCTSRPVRCTTRAARVRVARRTRSARRSSCCASSTPARWIDLVKEHRVTNTFSAPTQLKRIVVAARRRARAGRHVVDGLPDRERGAGAVRVEAGDHRRSSATASSTRCTARPSSASTRCCKPEDQLRKPGSCGKPYGGIEMKIVKDDGTDAATERAGRAVRPHRPRDGRLPPHRRAAHRARTDDEWKSVGDVAYVDDEGYVLHLRPQEGHDHLGRRQHLPGRDRSRAPRAPAGARRRGVRHPRRRVGRARARDRAGRSRGRRSTSTSCARSPRPRLANYKRPREYEVRAELPRTDSGKLLKRVLRDEYWQGRSSAV